MTARIPAWAWPLTAAAAALGWLAWPAKVKAPPLPGDGQPLTDEEAAELAGIQEATGQARGMTEPVYGRGEGRTP